MKIFLKNRNKFEIAFGLIVSRDTRLNSAGNLDIEYADMIFSFSDNYHFQRAIDKLNKNDFKENQDFEIAIDK